MLDFNKLMKQIDSVGQEAIEEEAVAKKIAYEAKRAYLLAYEKSKAFSLRLKNNRGLALWPISIPLEPFGGRFKVKESIEDVTIVAVDGSQIMPSQHEIHNCFLLNIGFVQLSYGTMRPPILESFPHLYHKAEDLYPLFDRRRFHIDELFVSLERSLLELTYLVDSIKQAKQAAQTVIAMIDGSLIPWSVERMPTGYQSRYIDKYIYLMEALEKEKVPIVGYISRSRSSEIVNDLRISICPYDESHCSKHCGQLNEENFPCSIIWPLLDRTMLAGQLLDYHRTNAFLSGASVIQQFPWQLKTCFLYVNIKEEIARLEFPQWLLSEQTLFDTTVGAVVQQTRKGLGYPIALAEAHHLAVIKGADRKQFFDVLSKHLILLGAGPVKLSPKENKKRIGLA